MTDPFAPPSGDPEPPAGSPSPPVYGTPGPPPPYAAPQYGAPQYGAPLAGGGQRNGFGVAALVLGILSLVTFWTFVGGIVLGILGLVFGILGRKRAKRGEATNGGMALAGAITGGLGILATAAYVVVIVLVLKSDSGQKLRDCLDRAGGDQSAAQQCQDQFRHNLTD